MLASWLKRLATMGSLSTLRGSPEYALRSKRSPDELGPETPSHLKEASPNRRADNYPSAIIQSLPEELLRHLLVERSSARDMAALACACKQFAALAEARACLDGSVELHGTARIPRSVASRVGARLFVCPTPTHGR
jgi:hypothetical protein